MRHFLLFICLTLTVCCMSSFASEISLNPPLSDLGDFDHSRAYLWAIDLNSYIPSGEDLVGVQLFIDNIQNWQEPENDILRINLLDLNTPANPGIRNQVGIYTDNENPSDFFGSAGSFETWAWTNTSAVGTYTDTNDSYYWSTYYHRWIHTAVPEDLFWDLDISTINSFSSNNGWIGIGFDPDCHYYNDGVMLKLTTIPTQHQVPEPGSLTLMLLGITGLAGKFLIKRKK